MSLDSVPSDVENLLIVLNARTEEKRLQAERWLHKLATLTSLRRVGLLLHSDEACHMSWALPHMTTAGGNIHFLFTVYDSPWVDDKTVFQWPLGVATYRGFPETCLTSEEQQSTRPYTCNFVGTVYKNTSREYIANLLNKDYKKECVVKTRSDWKDSETRESLSEYIQSLKLSDLTVNPVGLNAECYRMYEALECGSVPIVEDRTVSTGCDYKTGPLRLFKKYKAPILRVKNWTEMHDLLIKERGLSDKERVVRRERLVSWYKAFKLTMRRTLVKVINKKFFT